MKNFFTAKKKRMRTAAFTLCASVIASAVFVPAVSADRTYILNENFDNLENLNTIGPMIYNADGIEPSTDENYEITLSDSPTGIGKAMQFEIKTKKTDDRKIFKANFVFPETKTFSTAKTYIFSVDIMDTNTNNIKTLFTHDFSAQRGDAASKPSDYAYYGNIRNTDKDYSFLQNPNQKGTHSADNMLVNRPHKIAFVVSSGDVYKTIVDGQITNADGNRWYYPRPANNATFSKLGLSQFTYGSQGYSWYDNIKMYEVSGFEVLDTVFKIDGNPAARTAVGEATATITTFNTLAETKDCVLILASYENNKLKNVAYKPITVAASTGSYSTEAFSTDALTVTSTSETLKAFLWSGESLNGMSPVKNAEVLLGQ